MTQKNVLQQLLWVFSIIALCFGQVAAQEGSAGRPGEFLRYGVGGRALGMGHVFTGLADDASAVYWNPAGMMNMRRKEFTSMYTNLFLDSRYTYLAVALPRTFVGEQNAIGFGWVNLNMAGFEQRNADNAHIGDFAYYDQAFILSGARELVSTWGILNYGLNLKLINQAFPGLASVSSVSYASTGGWGFGADLGATFRPINAPLFKFVPLRRIMPLQFGFALQNVIPPRVGIGDGVKDKYPLAFRWGASYRLAVSDWRMNLLLDQEIFKGRQIGWFTGVEAMTPSPVAGLQPALRAGWNSRSNAPAFGAGIRLDYLDDAAIRIDFAYAVKPSDYLSDDFRLFLTVDFGRSYDNAYHAAVADSAVERKKVKELFHVLTRYSEDFSASRSAALQLAGLYDEINQDRYMEFIGGIEAIDWYYEQLQNLMIKHASDPNLISRLQRFADKILNLMAE